VERAAYRKDKDGPESTTRIYGAFRRYQVWVLRCHFEESVLQLHQQEYLDISVIHGDGTTTVAKAVIISDSETFERR